MQLPLDTIIVENDPKDMKRLVESLEPFKNIIRIAEKVYFYDDAVTLLSNRSFQLSILDIKLDSSKDCYDLIEEVGRRRFGILALTTGKKNVPPDKAHTVTEPLAFFRKSLSDNNITSFIKDLNEEIYKEKLKTPTSKIFWIEGSNPSGVNKPFSEDQICAIIAHDKTSIIYYISAETGEQTHFHSAKSFGTLLDKICSEYIIQCHRSVMVNIKFIKDIGASRLNGRQLNVAHKELERTLTYSETYIKLLSEKLNIPIESL